MGLYAREWQTTLEEMRRLRVLMGSRMTQMNREMLSKVDWATAEVKGLGRKAVVTNSNSARATANFRKLHKI